MVENIPVDKAACLRAVASSRLSEMLLHGQYWKYTIWYVYPRKGIGWHISLDPNYSGRPFHDIQLTDGTNHL